MSTRIALASGSALLCVAFGSAEPAAALDKNDSMAAWIGTSDADRSKTLDEMVASDDKLRHADRAGLLDCMNAAAGIAGHRDLRIGEVAGACAEAQAPDTGKPQTDI